MPRKPATIIQKTAPGPPTPTCIWRRRGVAPGPGSSFGGGIPPPLDLVVEFLCRYVPLSAAWCRRARRFSHRFQRPISSTFSVLPERDRDARPATLRCPPDGGSGATTPCRLTVSPAPIRGRATPTRVAARPRGRAQGSRSSTSSRASTILVAEAQRPHGSQGRPSATHSAE